MRLFPQALQLDKARTGQSTLKSLICQQLFIEEGLMKFTSDQEV